MALKRCANGHYFDPGKHTSCPSCGVSSIIFEPARTSVGGDSRERSERHTSLDLRDRCMGCMEPRPGLDVCPACGYVEGTPPANLVHLPPRTTLKDQYIVGRVLGHGGFGIAYIAWDTNLQMKIAVKEFFPGDLATRGVDRSTVTIYSGDARESFEYGLTRFLDEGRAIARFNDHPGIVPVLNFFRDNGTGYLVMQYVPGMSFKEYLARKGGRIPYDEAIAIAMPVMDTLRAVHEVGLLHRDISPDNIYVSASKQVKLLDFGAARQAMGDRSQTVSVILKAGYAPFEQYQTKGSQGPWTDVYALAATIYRAITGVVPPETPALIAGSDALQSPSAFDVAIPPAGEAVLLAALAIDPRERYQTITEFQQALLDTKAAASAPVSASASGAHIAPAASTAKPAATKAVRPSAADALGRMVDAIEKPIATASAVVQQRIGLALTPDERAALPRQGALIAAVVMGTLGVVWMVSMIGVFTRALAAGSSLPVCIALLRAFVGLAGGVVMTIGALAGLSGDRRGTAIVWGVGWLMVAAGMIGAALLVVSYIPTVSMGILWFSLTSEIWSTTLTLLPTLIVLVLLWLRSSARKAPATA